MSGYYDTGGISVIDAIYAKLTPDEYRGFLKGNVMKYIMRASFKGCELEDYKKACHYNNLLASMSEASMDIFSISAQPLDSETIRVHDALNDKIRRANMKMKFMAILRDSIYNREITINEMRYWMNILDSADKDRSYDKSPQPAKKRAASEISK